MSRKFRVDEAVWSELRDAVAWYEEQRLGLGDEFLVVVEHALDEIRKTPELWPLWKDNRAYRRRVLRRFPFSIFYAVDPDSIVIVALAHHKRRPGHWLP